MTPAIVRTHLAVLLACTVIIAQIAFAQWSISPTVNNAICTNSPGYQQSPTMVSDGLGGAIITWHDDRSGTSKDIYAQRINASGVVQWTSDGVAVCTATGDQEFPVIVSDGLGGAIITWEDSRTGSWDIYAQRINASGAVQWTSDGVALCAATGNQRYPSMATDDSGGAIITWFDSRNGTNDIYAQRINASGVAQWPTDGVAICTAAGDQTFPTLVSDDSGGAVITWVDTRNGSDDDIYAQRIDASGTVQWTNNGVGICTTSGDQLLPKLVSDGAHGAIITWEDYRSGSNYDVYAQKISATGTVGWDLNGVAICTTTGDQDVPTILADDSGGAIITWEDHRTGSSYDIYAQRINASGAVQWTSNGVGICTEPGDQTLPRITSDSSGGAIITWEDARNGSNNDIHAQDISASGVVQWTSEGVSICTSTGNRGLATLIGDEAGGAIITWQDYRNGNWDIYAQRVDKLGNIFIAPWIDKVGDIANDQGGNLRILWKPSDLDYWPNTTVRSYIVRMGTKNRGLLGKTTETTDERIYWQTVSTVSADWASGYTLVIPTYADSGLEGTPYYYFQVIATSSDSTLFALSNIDSAYSVDNIPPIGVSGAVVSSSPTGYVSLEWNHDKVDPDLMGYDVYRGTSSGFLVGPSDKIAFVRDTAFVDSSITVGSEYYYRVTAQDIHGNQGTASDEVSAVALLVQLTSFTASINTQSGITLQWQTSSESNLNGFEVEKKSAGSTLWHEIGRVQAHGTSSTLQSYSFVDQTVLAGSTGYRLKQVSNSGTYRYSPEVDVDFVPTTTSLSQNYPNPFNPVTTIHYELSEAGPVKLSVFDALGREVATLVNQAQQLGAYSVQWNASTMPSGVYFYRLKSVNAEFVKKLVVVR